MPAVFSPLPLFVFEQQQLKNGTTYENLQIEDVVDKKWFSIKYLQGADHQQREFFENNPNSGDC